MQFCQENAFVIANAIFQQHKRRLYIWTPLGSQYGNEIDYILKIEKLYTVSNKARN